jgi:hypothetical protein
MIRLSGTSFLLTFNSLSVNHRVEESHNFIPESLSFPYLSPNLLLGLESCRLNVKCKIENVKWKVEMQNKKDLKVRTKKFALRIIKMYSSLPKTAEAKIIGNQILHSGTSVGAVNHQLDSLVDKLPGSFPGQVKSRVYCQDG